MSQLSDSRCNVCTFVYIDTHKPFNHARYLHAAHIFIYTHIHTHTHTQREREREREREGEGEGEREREGERGRESASYWAWLGSVGGGSHKADLLSVVTTHTGIIWSSRMGLQLCLVFYVYYCPVLYKLCTHIRTRLLEELVLTITP